MAGRRQAGTRDVVVVGAGSSGLYLAARLGRAGVRVSLLEARRFARSGAGWINGVAPWMLDRAGLAVEENEIFEAHGPCLLVGPRKRSQLLLPVSPLLELDMGRFCERLRRQARAAGVEVYERVEGLRLRLSGWRATAVEFSGAEPGGRRHGRQLRVGLLVDATGGARALSRQHPAAAALWPEAPARLTCRAAQQVRQVRDRRGAQAFCERWRVAPGTTVLFACPRGGWSILNLRVSADYRQADLLAGCLATRSGHGEEMIAELVRAQPWLGKRLRGGAGDIFLRRPYLRPWVPGLALVGEAAGQVFGLHGSGTGSGLLGACRLAEAVERGGDPGGTAVLGRYARAAAREPGLRCTLTEPLVESLDELGAGGVARLLESGLFTAGALAAGLEQRLDGALAGATAARLLGLAGQPQIARQLGRAGLAGAWRGARLLAAGSRAGAAAGYISARSRNWMRRPNTSPP